MVPTNTLLTQMPSNYRRHKMLKCKILRWILRINNLPRPKVRDLWDNKRADLRGWEASAVEEPQTIWITCQNTPSRSGKYLQSNSKIKTCPQVQIITQKPKWSIQINNQSNCLSLPPARPQRVPTSPLSSLPLPCSQRAKNRHTRGEKTSSRVSAFRWRTSTTSEK